MTEAAVPPLTTPDKAELYRNALEMLNRSGVPYMIGGTYAFQYYAGIARTTKDFDIFMMKKVIKEKKSKQKKSDREVDMRVRP